MYGLLTSSHLLQECKLLLSSLLVLTVLPAWPEFLIRSSIPVFDSWVCILNTHDALYGLYVAFKLVVRHLLPATLITLCLLKPDTIVAKRISLIFMGEPSVCECGPGATKLVRSSDLIFQFSLFLSRNLPMNAPK